MNPYESIVGRKIRLLAMPDDPAPLPLGSIGIIRRVQPFDNWMQVWVKWDHSRSSIMLCVPPDLFEFVDEEKPL